MDGVLLVAHVLPQHVQLALPPLQRSQGRRQVLHPHVLLGEILLQFLVPDLEADDLEFEVVLVVLQHHAFAEFVFGVLGLTHEFLLQLLVVVLVDLRLQRLLPLVLVIVVEIHRLIFIFTVHGPVLALRRGVLRPLQTRPSCSEAQVLLGAGLLLVAAGPDVAGYWKMGFGLGLAVDLRLFEPLGRFEIVVGEGGLVVEAGGVDLLRAFGKSSQRAFAAGALADHAVDLEFAEGLGVEALGERDDDAVALGTHEFVVVELHYAGDVAGALLGDQADVEFGEHLLALLPQPDLLAEQELALLVGGHF